MSIPAASTALTTPLTTTPINTSIHSQTQVSRIPQPIVQHLNGSGKSKNQYFENDETSTDALQNNYEYVEFYDEDEEENDDAQKLGGDGGGGGDQDDDDEEETRPLQGAANEDEDEDGGEEEEVEEEYNQQNNAGQVYHRETLLNLRSL